MVSFELDRPKTRNIHELSTSETHNFCEIAEHTTSKGELQKSQYACRILVHQMLPIPQGPVGQTVCKPDVWQKRGWTRLSEVKVLDASLHKAYTGR